MGAGNINIPIRWIFRISFLYLLVPFLIFCLGFLRIYISICITLVILWLIIKNWRHGSQASQNISLSKRALWFAIFAVLLWVALSGIGGFAFQNTDFHIRNAIFHDLINYTWPVKYFTNPVDPSIAYTLTYYIGFWLPAALVGKIAGWQAANIALYVWAVLGVLLTLFLLASRIKLSPVKIALVLIFFSGMDALGTLLMMIAVPGTRNTLWPPIYHLEWWLPGFDFQYSSFTTQLFWIFNQAVPVWLCMALLFISRERKNILLVWSLCCFFAPLPALGMFPYVVLKIPNNLVDAENINARSKIQSIRDFFFRLFQDIRALFSVENIAGGGLVLGITLLYFLSNVQSSNSSTSASQIQGAGWIVYAIFLIFEGLLIWGILVTRYKTNLNWYLAGGLFIIIPLINIGSARDFGTLSLLLVIAFLVINLNVYLARRIHAWSIVRFFKYPSLIQKILHTLLPGIIVLGFLGIYVLVALALVRVLTYIEPRFAVFFEIQTWAHLKFLTSNIYVLFNYLQFAERYVYWTVGWNIFNAHPILGVGLGNAGFYFQRYLPAYGWSLPEVMQIYLREVALPNIKRLWVRLLAETGIVGFSSFFAWCYVMLRTAWSMRLNSKKLFKVIGWCGLFVLVAFITEGFSTDTFALPYLWVSLGIVSAAGALLRNPKEEI